jgi:beta-phosphoglucomutase family hydrolase
MFKAAIFDMDGVLVDNHHYHFMAWKDFCKNNNIPFNDNEFRLKYFGKSNADILTGLLCRTVSDTEAFLLGEEKEALYRKIYKSNIKPVNGLNELLDTLKSKGLKLAVATSAGKANLDFILNGLGLGPFFDQLVDSSYVKKAKPNPDIYLKAAELIGVKPNECVVFEDSVSGISAAKSAGMSVIGLLTTHKQEELPELQLFINDFLDVRLLNYLNINP